MKDREPTFEITIEHMGSDCSADIFTQGEVDLVNDKGEVVLEKELATRSGEEYVEKTDAWVVWNNDDCIQESIKGHAYKRGYAPGIHTNPDAVDQVKQEVTEVMRSCPYSSPDGCMKRLK